MRCHFDRRTRAREDVTAGAASTTHGVHATVDVDIVASAGPHRPGAAAIARRRASV